MRNIIAPSILSADFANLEVDISKVESVGCDFIHIDVLDGHFVPNISIGAPVVKSLRKVTRSTLDAHLMIENPLKYASDFAKAGADIITVHIETLHSPVDELKQLRSLGVKTGLSLNPDRSFDDIKDYIELVDMILVMSVFPGFGGQKFIQETLVTTKKIKKFIEEKQLNIDIQMDGGINKDSVRDSVEAGANILVAGSAIFAQKDSGKAFLELQNLARESEYVK